MKTTAKILVITATTAIFSLTVNAQNTKAVRMNLKTQFTEFITNRMEPAVNELAADLETLKAAVKFTPSVMNAESSAAEASYELAGVKDEMAGELKFKPSVNVAETEYTGSMETMNEIQAELQPVVKYNPGESMVNDTEMTDILNELKSVVKYTPAAAI